MDTYNRPITPPIDRSKVGATTIPTPNGGITTTPNYLDKRDELNDIDHLQRQQDPIRHSNLNTQSRSSFSAPAPVPSATNVPSTTHVPSTANPFVSHEDRRSSNPLHQDLSSSLNRDTTTTSSFGTNAHRSTAPISSINSDSHRATAPTASAFDTDTTSGFDHDTTSSHAFDHDSTTHKRSAPSAFDSQYNEHASTKKHTGQRNTTTYRIENEALRILQWQNPVRSGVLFAAIIGSIILTRWYSLLQIGSTCLTLAIGINLVYVNTILQSQKVLTNHQASHPYSDVIDNEKHSMINQESVNHYSTVITELSETVIRALTRIIFIENTMTSVKWMTIFFAIWKISAHFSTMDIVLMVVISAFTFPRLYISNKDAVDAHLQKGQTIIQTGINKAQTAATENVQNTYVKARAYVAQVGTTGTDAKNTLRRSSVTIKDEKTL
ncbi:Reticulon-domain-containing protein [Helicostylum pulchrum]|uniref:Reticulon-like protein n=1 Tax=Helicostylum pulchrum TaxID=562976 RepID=A0ABP9XL28_9FUNG|nr:Reticulon-domain-containing protein [Helicostylum pulchrum]